MNPTIVNLTPHAINLYETMDGGMTEVIEVCLPPARLTEARVLVGHITVGVLTLPVHRTEYGAITGLPERITVAGCRRCMAEAGVPLIEGFRTWCKCTVYLVSMPVAMRANRADVIGVDQPVRDAGGRVVGALGFARYDDEA